MIAGDLVDIPVEDEKGIMEPLKDLKAPMGKYYTTGECTAISCEIYCDAKKQHQAVVVRLRESGSQLIDLASLSLSILSKIL